MVDLAECANGNKKRQQENQRGSGDAVRDPLPLQLIPGEDLIPKPGSSTLLPASAGVPSIHVSLFVPGTLHQASCAHPRRHRRPRWTPLRPLAYKFPNNDTFA